MKHNAIFIWFFSFFFCFKIVFLENAAMLEEYVDLSCLPDELGGYDSFNVNEWVEYTTVNAADFNLI